MPMTVMGDSLIVSAALTAELEEYNRAEFVLWEIIQQFPQAEDAWQTKAPQSDSEVTDLFQALTMHQVPYNTRKVMPCRYLLERFLQEMPQPPNHLYCLTLAAACSVAMSNSQLTQHEVKDILADIFPTAKKDLKSAVMSYVKMLDMLTQHQILGKRAHEIPIRCEFLSIECFADFSAQSFVIANDMMRKSTLGIWNPEPKLDSSRLRMVNVVYQLFAGRFSESIIETNMLRAEPEHPLTIDARPIFARPAHVLLPLNARLAMLQSEAAADTILLAPTLRREPHMGVYDSKDFWPELSGFAPVQEKMLKDAVEETGQCILGFNGYEGIDPRIIRVDQTIGALVPDGFMGFGILLRDGPMEVVFDKEVVIWRPDHILGFRGGPPKFKDGASIKFFFLLVLLEIEAY